MKFAPQSDPKRQNAEKDEAEDKEAQKKSRKPRKYVPKFRSGAYAILVALYLRYFSFIASILNQMVHSVLHNMRPS